MLQESISVSASWGWLHIGVKFIHVLQGCLQNCSGKHHKFVLFHHSYCDEILWLKLTLGPAISSSSIPLRNTGASCWNLCSKWISIGLVVFKLNLFWANPFGILNPSCIHPRSGGLTTQVCVTQHIKRYQLLENSVLSYECAKPEYLKIWSLGQFWDFTYFGIFNTNTYRLTWLSKLLEGFDVKTSFSCKKWTFELLLYASTLPKLYEPFSPNQLFADLLWCSQWNYHIARMHCPIWKPFATTAN